MLAALMGAIFGSPAGAGGNVCGPIAVAQQVAGMDTGNQEPISLNERRAQIEETVSLLDKGIKDLDGKIKKQEDVMKQLNDAGHRQRALQTLVRVKAMRTQLKALIAQHGNMVTALDQINANALTQEVMDSMRSAAEVLQIQAANPALKDVDSVMLSLEDQSSALADANEALSKPISGADVTENDLDAELAALEDPEAFRKPLVLPSVPYESPAQPTMGGGIGVAPRGPPVAAAVAAGGGGGAAVLRKPAPAAATSTGDMPLSAASLYTDLRPSAPRASAQPKGRPVAAPSARIEDPAMKELDDAIHV